MIAALGGLMFLAGVVTACGWILVTSWRGLLPTWSEFVLLGALVLCAAGVLLAGWTR
jgi:hypothetical protein